VYKFVLPFFVALVSGSMVTSALGSETRDGRNSNSCEMGRAGEQHAWLGWEKHRFGFAADVRKIENAPSALNAGSNSQYAVDRPSPAGSPRDTDQPGKLALLENAPLPLKDSSKAAAIRQDQTWVRLSDTPNMPEPGSWAVLLAGFLGICAVARPRIFSS
jgi:hypothetical protein